MHNPKLPNIRMVLLPTVCMCRCMGHLHSSTWNVTKHRGQSPSPTGVNWVSDGVGNNSIEYMRHEDVCFSGSLK